VARARQRERSVSTRIGPGLPAHRFAVQRRARPEHPQPVGCAGPARLLDLSQTSTSFPDALPAAAATSHVIPDARSRQPQPMKGIPHERSTSSR
jgi:hypothetical protein